MPSYNELPIFTENKTYIYNNGIEYFGGFVSGWQNGVTPTRTKNSNNYYLGGTGTSSAGCNGSSVTDETIDLTSYSKIGAILSLSTNLNTVNLGFGVGTTKAMQYSNMTRGISSGPQSSFSLNNVKLEFDISDLSGEYYVGICGTAGINATWSIQVLKLYLIK